MITAITGHFKEFDLTVKTEEDDFTKACSIVFTADVEPIETNNAQRDGHLKSQDFFGGRSKCFPSIKIHRKRNTKKSGDNLSNLHQANPTIRDVTKSITSDVEFGGIVADPYRQTKAGFTLEGKIKRKDFKLEWNAVTEAGQIVVSNDVRIPYEIQ